RSMRRRQGENADELMAQSAQLPERLKANEAALAELQEQMQQIAHWTNLSETAFLLPPTQPGASYRVRIFTPRQELPFAGHPSVGAAHAVLEAGLARAVNGIMVQECGAGLLPLRVSEEADGRWISILAPPARTRSVPDSANQALCRLLQQPRPGLDPQIIDIGPHWWVLPLPDTTAVRALQPDMAALAALTLDHGAVGVAVYAKGAVPEADVVIRCFCPADGIPEDPVTGSGNAAVAAFLRDHGQLPAASYVASQGRELGRDGIVRMQVDASGIHLGGQAVTVVEGSIRLD
ncbi:MAG: PhzF family phenazine biosynthesis protein, partial [Xanthomonadales bacterium]|nr:PhzF family phenazine biosynthesis protein [Xanthomonadales bacterium]